MSKQPDGIFGRGVDGEHIADTYRGKCYKACYPEPCAESFVITDLLRRSRILLEPTGRIEIPSWSHNYEKCKQQMLKCDGV